MNPELYIILHETCAPQLPPIVCCSSQVIVQEVACRQCHIQCAATCHSATSAAQNQGCECRSGRQWWRGQGCNAQVPPFQTQGSMTLSSADQQIPVLSGHADQKTQPGKNTCRGEYAGVIVTWAGPQQDALWGPFLSCRHHYTHPVTLHNESLEWVSWHRD